MPTRRIMHSALGTCMHGTSPASACAPACVLRCAVITSCCIQQGTWLPMSSCVLFPRCVLYPLADISSSTSAGGGYKRSGWLK